MKKAKILKIVLIIVIVFAFFLRVINLEHTPKGLFSDEGSFLINAVSIMQTGKDEDGRFMPLMLHSLIDSKPALYSYLQIPFTAALRAATTAARLPAVLMGTASIYLFYLLLKRWLQNDWLAVIGALLLAISPWHIMNSRATQEVIMSFFFLLINLIVFFDIYSKKFNKKRAALFFVSAILAMYSYHSAKIVLIGLYTALTAYYLLTKNSLETRKKMLKAGAIVTAAFALTLSTALVRFSTIGIFYNDLPIALIHEVTTKATGSTPLILIRAFYNKPVFYFRFFLEHYLKHFDLNFLFTTGGATLRYIVPHHGLFYMFELGLAGLGLYQLFIKKKYKKFLPIWSLLLILSPIPAAMTIEELPSSIRPFYLVIPIMVLVVLGLEFLSENISQKIKPVVYGLLVITYVWSLSFYLQQLFVIMPEFSPWRRSREHELAAQALIRVENNYDSIIITNDLREMYLYLWLHDLITLEQIQQNPLARYEESYSLGKYHFNQQQCNFDKSVKNDLLISPKKCLDGAEFSHQIIEAPAFAESPQGLVLFERTN